MDNELQKWREEGKHLPTFLRDFHDQKNLFKYLHETIDFENDPHLSKINWIDGHIYTIDIFLYVLAKYGYTLQKSRAKLPFENLSDSIEKNNEYRREMFTKAMLNLNNDNPKSE